MFRLIWLPVALNDLAAIWTESDSPLRRAITAAAQAIDATLQADPLNQGESRAEDERVMFQLPLGITYQVQPQSSTVRVMHVWLIRPRKQG